MINASAEQRFSIYYAVLFGSIGAMFPFAALWMSDAGIEPAMIGFIVAVPSVAMLFTTISIGRWADSLQDRRLAIIVGNWLILAIHLFLYWSTGEWMVLFVWLLAGVTMSAKMPITDAAALSLTQQRNSDFARVRMFGSIGFVVLLTLAGYAYEFWGIGIFVTGLLVANILRLAAAYALPRMPRTLSTTLVTDNVEGSSAPLYKPAILFTLIGAALINASHAMVYTYGILLWTEQGLSESVAGMAVSIGVVVEVVLMWWFKSLTRNISARVCLLAAALSGVLRWSVLAVEPSWLLVFSMQALHGITFGIMFLACTSFISRRVPEEYAARGQGLLAILSTACMAAATLICGQLFVSWGSHLYWVMGVMCALAIVFIMASYRFTLTD